MRNPVSTGTMAIPSSCCSVANSTLCHPIASFPASMFHSQSHRFSKRVSGNGNWVRERRRLSVKSSNSEAKTDEATQKSTSSTEDNPFGTSAASGNSSSFLSLLCPLLKLFSVSLLPLFAAMFCSDMFICVFLFGFSVLLMEFD